MGQFDNFFKSKRHTPNNKNFEKNYQVSAALTRIPAPLTLKVFKPLIAFMASRACGISTKPKPLDLPEAGSRTNTQDYTCPKG